MALLGLSAPSLLCRSVQCTLHATSVGHGLEKPLLFNWHSLACAPREGLIVMWMPILLSSEFFLEVTLLLLQASCDFNAQTKLLFNYLLVVCPSHSDLHSVPAESLQ